MEKMKMQTHDGVEINLDRIAQLFPGCITETRDEKGSVKRAVDFDLLRQELSGDVVEGPVERYQLNWPGKRQAVAAANAPINKTLRPCEKESVNFDTTGNLYIEGDNLDALKLLQETYLGKVKMIYIDPPYNTGNDFIYKDNFTAEKEEYEQESGQRDAAGQRLFSSGELKQNPESNGLYHSDWLSMMLPRLRLARNLLREDGVIFISIDDNEVSNLRKLCDEVFGEKNFCASFLWKKKSTTSNVKDAEVSAQVDYQLCYKKTSAAKLKQRTKSAESREYPHKDDEGCYRTTVIEKKDSGAYKRDTMKFEILGHSPRDGKRWQIGEKTARDLETKNRFVWDGSKILLKIYEHEDTDTYSAQPNLLDNHGSSDSGAQLMNTELFETPELFDNPKPIELLMHFANIAQTENEIILDFFSGSSATAHAVMQLNAEDDKNRKFIMVQLPEACDEKSEAFKAGYKNICEIGKERIRRAGQKIKEENATNAPNLDIGFRVLKVDTSNMKDVWYTPDQLKQHEVELFTAHIKEDRTAEDLLFQIMLDWGSPTLDAKIRKEKVGGKTVFIVNDNDILACFEEGITEKLVKQMAAFKPLRAVFRDDAFDDSLKINVEQIFKVLSPGTEVKSI
jgi:adenine-specific DNA-methyltransferase